ncbi:membrane-bound lytic murein transglycosylase MltF [Buttiauxella sp. BIGb0471]|uniref:transporter substrate-binding domain-containing protein n=1 Tax=Buttiauxella sp. BIGb0471 TaxID=2940597 RepID=UPI00216A1879|nr:transporter substrate-binding domain-containing protein [Buttiauxella sp. BIGb0471]MCS3602635.1 membrane-bound lytic murein transglycosylase MltF [Buttiauxella sp. BIGb0471]
MARWLLVLLLMSPFLPMTHAATDEQPLKFDTKVNTVLGDYDVMKERRVIRVLIPYSKTFYFIDNRGTQRGIMVELMQQFDKQINKGLKPSKKTHLLFIPTARDQLIPQLIAGRGDIIAANLTITPEREKLVDFSDPLAKNVREVVIASGKAPELTTAESLSGKSLFVNPSTSYISSIVTLNKSLTEKQLPPAIVIKAPGNFEPEDILEMVNANLADYTVVDRYLAILWKQIYPNIVVYENITLRDDGSIALAMRKNSPLLKAQLDKFTANHKIGTSFGNQQVYKYLRNTKWVKDARSEEEINKFNQVTEIFRKYSAQYNVDWLLMAAQGYQESRLDQSVRSKSGAIGVMQVLPTTGKELKVGDISLIDPNINAGVKYIRFMRDRYFADEPMSDMNKMLFTFASYNAGPAKIARLRKEATKNGLDPNIWFNNVERIAQLRIGNETVQYVSNIFKYYIAYQLIMEQIKARKAELSVAASTAE